MAEPCACLLVIECFSCDQENVLVERPMHLWSGEIADWYQCSSVLLFTSLKVEPFVHLPSIRWNPASTFGPCYRKLMIGEHQVKQPHA